MKSSQGYIQENRDLSDCRNLFQPIRLHFSLGGCCARIQVRTWITFSIIQKDQWILLPGNKLMMRYWLGCVVHNSHPNSGAVQSWGYSSRQPWRLHLGKSPCHWRPLPPVGVLARISDEETTELFNYGILLALGSTLVESAYLYILECKRLMSVHKRHWRINKVIDSIQQFLEYLSVCVSVCTRRSHMCCGKPY